MICGRFCVSVTGLEQSNSECYCSCTLPCWCYVTVEENGKPVVFTVSIQSVYTVSTESTERTILLSYVSRGECSTVMWIYHLFELLSDSQHIGWIPTQRKLSSRIRLPSLLFLYKMLNLLLVEYLLLLYSFT